MIRVTLLPRYSLHEDNLTYIKTYNLYKDIFTTSLKRLLLFRLTRMKGINVL
jgi:hypothetical protein